MSFDELVTELKNALAVNNIDGQSKTYLLLAWTAGRLYELKNQFGVVTLEQGIRAITDHNTSPG